MAEDQTLTSTDCQQYLKSDEMAEDQPLTSTDCQQYSKFDELADDQHLTSTDCQQYFKSDERAEDHPLTDCQPLLTSGWTGSTKYDNPKEWKDWRRPNALSFLKMKCKERNQAGIPSKLDLDKTLPVHFIEHEERKKLENPPESDIQIMWIGHATLLVQFGGITLLTDPVFLDRCSPTQMVGPKRYRPVPCSIEDLPGIDAVVISHNHYDHLEYDAVVNLLKINNNIKWFVPMGLKSWFLDWIVELGCQEKNVIEMTWWDIKEHVIKEKYPTKFICVPAQHWSQRNATDAMKSLWCGWVVKTDKLTFYYSGDTGYCPVFKQIGKKFGPMDLSAIPIGCYEPKYFMKPQHIDPEQAVTIHKEVGSKKSVGIHWGTFDGLGSHEHYLEPKEKLEEEARKQLQNEDFFTVEHGEIKVIKTTVN